jgi:hypothetical protein
MGSERVQRNAFRVLSGFGLHGHRWADVSAGVAALRVSR